MALAGNIIVLVCDNDSKVPFIVGTGIIGFAESIACMQSYVKEHLSASHEDTKKGMQLQYASVMVGVTVAFYAGGAIYQHYGVDGIAIFGMVFAGCELAALTLFLFLEPRTPPAGTDFENVNCSIRDEAGSRVLRKMSACSDIGEMAEVVLQANERDVAAVVNLFNASGASANYINYILCMTFAMESITIGYNLAISPVYILEQFGKDTASIGLIFGFGAMAGTMLTFFLSFTQYGEKFMAKYLPTPLNIYVAFVGISLSVFMAAVPVFPVHVAGMIFLMAFNDYGAFALSIMQGTVTSEEAYKSVGPIGQIIRR